MSSLYTEIIHDAYRHPRHCGELEGATHSFQDENPLCGDMLRVQLRVENGYIAEARFQGQGCAISQAAIELVLDRLEHQPVSVIGVFDHHVVLEELGLPAISPVRLKCALLSLVVIKGGPSRWQAVAKASHTDSARISGVHPMHGRSSRGYS